MLFGITHSSHTPLTHTHQPHFSSNPRTNLNSTHNLMASSGRQTKPRPTQIVPPPPLPLLLKSRHTTKIAPQHQWDCTHSTSLPCSTVACHQSTTAITIPAIIQATFFHELWSTSKLPIYLHNPIPISANPHPPCPIHTHPI